MAKRERITNEMVPTMRTLESAVLEDIFKLDLNCSQLMLYSVLASTTDQYRRPAITNRKMLEASTKLSPASITRLLRGFKDGGLMDEQNFLLVPRRRRKKAKS